MLLALLLVLAAAVGAPRWSVAAPPTVCPPMPSVTPTPLPPGGGEALEVTGPCTVAAGTYHYGDVNIYGGGSLTFADDPAGIHFWATSILIENDGALRAGTPIVPIGTAGGTLTFHLYGPDQGAAPFGTSPGMGGQGITCKSPGGTCGVPPAAWTTEPTAKTALPGGVTDFFYAYDPLPYDDGGMVKGFFGYKTLALSYGGTLELYGKKGATYGPVEPSNSGTSWVRLAQTLAPGGATLALDRPVDWAPGDQIVVTSTDYLPGHAEQLTIATVSSDRTSVTVTAPARYRHSGERYAFGTLPARLGIEADSAETRAAVALLSRSIRIVSAGDAFGTPLPDGPGQYFGGHTIARQGFTRYRVQGVEFQQLGQGGRIGHYPVHFHMARQTPADTLVADCSVHDSMTRWFTVHATHGVTLARNVGYLSIGHGYYIEDGTEIENRFLSNIGIFARAAVDNAQNPRQVPGILAAPDAPGAEIVPYHSDYDHPAVFWIMNGYNDFQYNMAAGAGACGVCFWLVPSSTSGPSRHQHWESYASLQSNASRQGLTPLKSFTGNFCASAMNSFNVVGNTTPCLGIGPQDPDSLPAVANPLAPASTAGTAATDYYPDVGGGSRLATRCDQDDCSTVAPCGEGSAKANCMVTVLDRYTSSFHWTETNFGAIWLRPHWFLVTDSVLTDVQNGGLTFVTGGDYTRSSNIGGNWMLARRNVFVGRTQPENPFASDAGPVNGESGLTCDTPSGNNCLLRAEGVALPLSNFGANQRLLNIYDGPAFQDSNAFLDITTTPLTDCPPGSGPNASCPGSASMYGRVLGVPRQGDTCYLPNAAIGWKQPNGFYYPPAFQSENLFFRNVGIRHFVIEPSFLPDTFKTDPVAIESRYCTRSSAMFDNWTAVDRQTVLNDVDGALTGLVGTTSVNEDSFFAAPVETIECASDQTARTSPYDYVTTALYPSCAATNSCTDWSADCTNPGCYGVPLYRQYLTTQEERNPKLAKAGTTRSIRLMGAAIGQRSSLTANNGLYYVDTTVGRDRQTAGGQGLLNVFQPGQTYNLFLLYAKPTTTQTYQLYVGKDAKWEPSAQVSMVRANIDTAQLSFTPQPWPAGWSRDYDVKTGMLTVQMDMSGFAADFDAERAAKCQPATFCSWNGNQCVCALDPSDPLYAECMADDSAICGWAGRDNDCPAGGCLGFSVTLSSSFATDPKPDPRPDPVPFPSTPAWNVAWDPASSDLAGDCADPPRNYVIGTDASERLVGTKRDDVILGKGGNDRINGRGGNDLIWAGAGDDIVRGGKGHDRIDGGSGRDRLLGGPGRDECVQGERQRRCR